MAEEPSVNVAVRIPPVLAARLDTIAAGLEARTPGLGAKRSDAIRVCLERGAPLVEAELGLIGRPTAKKGAKPAHKPAAKK
jgi:hypothetical protein